jgi:hypothetical protein
MSKSKVGYKMPKDGEYILRDGWYWPDNRCVRGHKSPRNRFKHCVQCVRDDRKKNGHYSNTENAKRWRDENKKSLNEKRKQYNKENPERRMVAAAKKTAKSKGLDFNIDASDIVIPDECPVLGIKLQIGVGTRSDNSPSLDRIVPSKGYTKGNVIVISWRANRLKQDATIEEMDAIASFYKQLIATKD